MTSTPGTGSVAARSRLVEEVHETERHLLYVAVAQARDERWVSGVSPASDYRADL